MPYTYHSMTRSDYDEAYALWRAVPGIGLSAADEREPIARYLERNPGQSFICKHDGTLVGTILCGNDGRRAYIHHAVVAPEHRKRGVAAELVRLALAEQKQCGIDKCHLFVFQDNEDGKAFWARMGFHLRNELAIFSKNL